MTSKTARRISFSIISIFMLGLLAGCQGMADKYIDDFLERKGAESIEKVIDQIVQKRRTEQAESNREPSLQDKMKNRIKVDIKGTPIKGKGSIVMVEFSDFECPFCARVLPTVDKVMEDYKGKVRLAFKHNPLPFHQNAMPAAKAGTAA
jgi:thiol-disulfide isomerase/thioredoxin